DRLRAARLGDLDRRGRLPFRQSGRLLFGRRLVGGLLHGRDDGGAARRPGIVRAGPGIGTGGDHTEKRKSNQRVTVQNSTTYYRAPTHHSRQGTGAVYLNCNRNASAHDGQSVTISPAAAHDGYAGPAMNISLLLTLPP